MFSNIGGLEVVFVMVVALIVLGPTKLPEAARQIGKFVNQVRQISSGFQREFREAIQDPIVEAEARAKGAIEQTKSSVIGPFQGSHPPGTNPHTPAPNANGNGAAKDSAKDTESTEDQGAAQPTPPPADGLDND